MSWRYQSRLLPPLSIALDLPLATPGFGKEPRSPAPRKARRTGRRRTFSCRNSTSRCPPLCYLLVPPTHAPMPPR
jgi:hypothetical protein